MISELEITKEMVDSFTEDMLWICENSNSLTIEEAIKKLDRWLNDRDYRRMSENSCAFFTVFHFEMDTNKYRIDHAPNYDKMAKIWLQREDHLLRSMDEPDLQPWHFEWVRQVKEKLEELLKNLNPYNFWR